MDEEHDILTYKEVAKYLKVSENQVRKYTRDVNNPLPYVSLSPGTVRFRKDQLLAWLAGTFMDSNLEKENENL